MNPARQKTLDVVQGRVENVDLKGPAGPIARVRDLQSLGLLDVFLSHGIGDKIVVPNVGDNWWIQRRAGVWHLMHIVDTATAQNGGTGSYTGTITVPGLNNTTTLNVKNGYVSGIQNTTTGPTAAMSAAVSFVTSGFTTLAGTTVIPFNTRDFDAAPNGTNLISVNTNPGRFTVPSGYSGKWLLTASVFYLSPAAISVEVAFRKNGTTNIQSYWMFPTTTVNYTGVLSSINQLSSSDYVEVTINFTGNQEAMGATTETSQTRFAVTFLGT